MDEIREQIESLLTGEQRSLSVHEQWEYAHSLKKLQAVYEAGKHIHWEGTDYSDMRAFRKAIDAVQTRRTPPHSHRPYKPSGAPPGQPDEWGDQPADSRQEPHNGFCPGCPKCWPEGFPADGEGQ